MEESRRRQRRAILHNFYGSIDSKTHAQKTPNPSDIDDPSFDPDRYFNKQLQTQTLRQLLTTNETLLKEIKKLDSDMKTLVYENYNKFISATDTIRDMKSKVENMEEEMERLSNNLDVITNSTLSINGTLAPRRQKVQELNGVYRLLKQRQFLFELPTRLKKAIEMGSYNQAVFYYNKTHHVLEKYSNVPSFLTILRECEEMISTLKSLLRDKIQADLPLAEVVEAIGLLLDLNEPADELRKTFITGRGKLLLECLSKFEGHVLAKKAATRSEPLNESNDRTQLLELIEGLHQQFLGDFSQFCTSYHSLFTQRSPSTEDGAHAVAALEEFSHDLFEKYFGLVRCALLLHGQWVAVIMDALRKVQDDLLRLQAQVPEVGIEDVARDIIDSTLQKLMNRRFKIAKNALQAHMQALSSVNGGAAEGQAPSTSRLDSGVASSQSLREQCNAVSQALISEIEHFIEHFKVLFTMSQTNDFVSRFANVFLTRVIVNTHQLLLSINLLLSEYCEETGTCLSFTKRHKVRPIVALQLARVSNEIQSNGVPHVQNLLQNLAEFSSFSPESDINVPDLVRRLGQSTRKLLAYYVKCQGQDLSQMIRKCIETANWLSMREPRGVRPAIELLVSEILNLSNEVSEIIDKNPQTSVERPISVSSVRPSRSRYETPIGDLFEKKIQIFSPVAPDLDSILLAIIKISLKSFFEFLRLQTLSKYGYQQVQVDAEYMRRILEPYACKDKGLFARLLEEVLKSAADRCVDPHPAMEHGIVEIISRGPAKKD